MWRFLVALSAVGLGACGGSAAPIAPSPAASSAALPAGLYRLALTGFDFSDGGSEPTCTPAGVPPAGKVVRAELMLERQGDEWVGRLVDDDADVEVRVRDGGPIASGRRMSGMLRGWLTDRGTPPALPSGVVATVQMTPTGDFAILDGEVPALLPSSVFATAEGSIAFTDGEGRSSSCPSVQVTLGHAASAQPGSR